MRPMGNKVDSIIRNELQTKLEQNMGAHLTSIHAPAGYGKTTLLTQHYELMQSKGYCCCWLTLDNIDEDPVQFLAYLAAAMEPTQLLPEDVARAAFNGFHGLDLNGAQNLVINLLSSFDVSVYFFLDGYHYVASENQQHIVIKLIDLTTENIHFIVTSRQQSPDLKGRLQISRPYFELDIADLALTTSEINEVLKQSTAVSESVNLANLLQKETEGWGAAIGFAKIWINKNPELDISQLIHPAADFFNFITTEIFDNLSEQLQKAMIKTAIFKQFDGDLIDAVCETTGGWEIMEQLAHHDLIISTDKTNKTYRYHSLLTDFLLNRFNKSNLSSKQNLHRLAANCYLRKNDFRQTMQQAIASEDANFIASITEDTGGWHHILDGRISMFTDILDALPLDITKQYPSTYLGRIMLDAKTGNVGRAVKNYEAFRNATREFTQLNGKTLPTLFTIEAEVVNFYLSALTDRPQTSRHLAKMELTLKGINKNDHFLQANILNYLSFGYFDHIQFDEAFKAGERAILQFRALDSIYGENFLYFHLGKICLAQGRLRDAEQFYNEGYQLAVKNFGAHSNMAAIAAAHLAEVAYEKNKINQAQSYLSISFPKIELSEAWFDVYISAYFTAANIAYTTESTRKAIAILHSASLTGKRRGIGRLRLMSMIQRLRILLHDGNLKKAGWIIKQLNLFGQLTNNSEQKLTRRVSEELQTTLGYYLIRNDQARDGILLIEPLIKSGTLSGCRRNLISLTILMSLAYFNLGETRQSLTRLNDALSLAIFEDFKRPFLDYSAMLQEILELAINKPKLFAINQLKRSFLTQLISIMKRDSKSRINHSVSLLTPREQEVAQFVYDGYSNKEIARSCNCSANTVKFHLKNIFFKLDIRSRKELARMAWSFQ